MCCDLSPSSSSDGGEPSAARSSVSRPTVRLPPVLGHHPTPSGFSPYSAGSKLAAGWTGSSSLGVGRRECSREATSLTLTLFAQPALSANAQSPMRGAVQQYIYFGIKRIAQNSLYFAPPMAAGASSPSSTSGKGKTQTADPFLCCSVVPRPFSPIGSHACLPVLAPDFRPNQATRSSRGPTPGTPTCARRRATTRLCTSHPLVLTSDRHSASALSGLPLKESVSALGSARRLRGASRVGWQNHALTLPPPPLSSRSRSASRRPPRRLPPSPPRSKQKRAMPRDRSGWMDWRARAACRGRRRRH